MNYSVDNLRLLKIPAISSHNFAVLDIHFSLSAGKSVQVGYLLCVGLCICLEQPTIMDNRKNP